MKDKKSMSNMLLKQFNSVFSSPSINYVIEEPTSFFYDRDEGNPSMRPELTDITSMKTTLQQPETKKLDRCKQQLRSLAPKRLQKKQRKT